MSTDGDIAALTYEQALAELDTLIQRLEGGAVNLDEAITCYERASRLAQHCADLLDRTEQKITQLVVGPAGPQERPFSPEAAASAPAPAPSGTRAVPASPAPASAGSGVPPVGGGLAGASSPPPSGTWAGQAGPAAAPSPGAARARSVRPSPSSVPPLPGLEPPPPSRGPEPDIDPEDIPF